MIRLPAIICIAALFAPAVGAAQAHPLVDSRKGFIVGEFFADTRVRLSVNGNVVIVDNEFDFNESVGEPASDETFAVELWLRIGERWMVAAQIFDFSSAATRSLERDIPWRDVVYPAGITVTGGTGLDITRVFVSRDFARDERTTFGVGIGLHQLDLSAFIEGEAFIGDLSTGVQRGVATTNGVLPNIGARYAYAVNDKWALNGRLDWLSADVGKYDGTIINLSAGVHYSFAKHFGIGLSYNLFQLDIGVSEDNWRGDLNIRYHGPFLNLAAYWD